MSTQSKTELKEQTCGRMRVLKGEQGERKLTFMNFRYTEIKKDRDKHVFYGSFPLFGILKKFETCFKFHTSIV